MKDLVGKSVLVTGAASGIGRATALGFAREGADPVVICDINREGLEETAARLERLGCEVLSHTVDVTDFEKVKETADDVIERIGHIDVLANVAGISLVCPVELLDMDDWKKVLGVDLWGVIHMVQAVYPHMVRRGSGHIVSIASTDGLFVMGPYFSAPYCASKYGVVGFSEDLLYEAMLNNIDVSCVCPGAVKTPIFDATPVKGFKPELEKEIVRYLMPLAEEPEDTARALVDAVKRNRFLVVTTWSMKVAYFLRRHFPRTWFASMRLFTLGMRGFIERNRVAVTR
jgi:NAD(P)-dependent dehydrogenase (short-subunit alcohol dehydrogenase family)